MSEKQIVRLRRADESDSRQLWEWANDPVVRAASFSQQMIPWEDHVAWFIAKLCSPAVLYYVGIGPDGTPVGAVRFDIKGSRATISIVVSPQSRGQGIGTYLIQAASAQAFREAPLSAIEAYIKPENRMSVRAFTKSGFTEQDTVLIQGQNALCMTLLRPSPL